MEIINANMVQQSSIPFFQNGDASASLTIRSTNWKTARNFLFKWHYLKDKMPAGIKMIWGIWDYELAGIAVFTNTRCREWDKKGKIWELARFALRDDLPKNSESWFLSRLCRLARKYVDFIIAYSDPEQHHIGTIYKASCFHFWGQTKPRKDTFYLDGKRISARTIFDKFDTSSIPLLREQLGNRIETRRREGKFLYIKELKRNKKWNV